MKYTKIADDVKLGQNVRIADFVNLYGCSIGDETRIGAFVEVQKNAIIGKRCKISSHTFICEGVTIGDNCFIGHGVVFINDKFPRAVNKQGEPEKEEDWKNRFLTSQIGNNVSIGSNVTLMGGIKVGDNTMIGAGSVVTKDIPSNQIWFGNPAKFFKNLERICKKELSLSI